MVSSGSRRKRRRISVVEHTLSFIILIALVGFGGGVLWRGSRPVPSSPLEQLVQNVPAGWALCDEMEEYGADDLYIKINGRADLYLDYDVQSLEFASFCHSGSAEAAVDVFFYDMGEPLNAFGIYSRERSSSVEQAEVGALAYRVEGSLFFIQDRYYVQVLNYEPEGEALELVKQVGESLEALLPRSRLDIPVRQVFPEEDRITGSLRYEKRDALGLEFLEDVYTMEYRYQGETLTVFIKECGSPQQARSLVGKYTDANMDEYSTLISTPADPWSIIDYDGWFDVAFSVGRYFCGVYQAEDLELAREFSSTIREKLGS